ncbi:MULTISPECIES: DUF3822 family protein [Sphingobacterium]|uniref:DUF3822 family protein n=1 Tax=Sphingobacterium TaxID=28453 RepID=UPI0013DC0070|nr:MULTISPECIES: DUF3822 family protein [unclassified Sphingobacterium]
MIYIADDFHLHYLATYTLCIQSDFQNDHLVVLDEEKQVLVYMTYDNVSPSAEAVRILSMPFQNVIVGLPHQNLVWVPSEVYHESEKELYTNYFVDSEVNRIMSKEIAGLEVVALYQYDQLLYSRWKNLFADASFIPNFEVVIRQVQSNIPIQGDVLGVHLYDDQADIFLFMNGELKLYNTFEVATSDDLSYFVLNVFKNFAIKSKVPKIVLSGTNKDSEWFVRLSRYTDHIEMIRPKEKWSVLNLDVERQLEELNALTDSVLCV